MKRASKKSDVTYNQSDISLDLLIKRTASEFGLSEQEVRACAANFVKHNEKCYPAKRNPFATV